MEDMPSENTPAFQNSTDVKLDYLQRDIREIKSDVKDIKQDFVSRREYTDGLQTVRKEFTDADILIKQGFMDAVQSIKDDIALPKKIIYGTVGLILITFLGAIIALVIK